MKAVEVDLESSGSGSEEQNPRPLGRNQLSRFR